jgi:hypothetical protein
MVESGTVAEVSRMSIMFAAVFTVVGIGLLYLYIAIADVSNETKILLASGLSLGVAVTALIIWTLSKDFGKSREAQRKISP